MSGSSTERRPFHSSILHPFLASSLRGVVNFRLYPSSLSWAIQPFANPNIGNHLLTELIKANERIEFQPEY